MTKTAIIVAVGLAALMLIAAPASAGEQLRLVPPKEYDHAYDGHLEIVPAHNQNHVRELCPGSNFSMGEALACAHIRPGSCRIVMAHDDVIRAAGLPPDLVRHHELAHCNGWPGDHRGARPYEEWALKPGDPDLCRIPFTPGDFCSRPLPKN
jgi:hypothetical protein